MISIGCCWLCVGLGLVVLTWVGYVCCRLCVLLAFSWRVCCSWWVVASGGVLCYPGWLVGLVFLGLGVCGDVLPL